MTSELGAPFNAAIEDGVTLYWFDTIVEDLGFNPDTTPNPVPLQPEPWDMSTWDTNPPLTQLIRELAAKASGGMDVTDYLYQQQDLAWFIEQQDQKNWRNSHATQKDHLPGHGDTAGRDAAVGGGGSRDASSGPEDGDQVGGEMAGQAAFDQNAGGAPPVQSS